MTQQKAFEVPQRVARLEFEQYPGLYVRASLDISMGAFFSFQRLVAAQDPEKIEEAMRRFGDEVLIETNITVQGEAITANGDGFLRLPAAFGMEIITAWSEAVQNVSGPLAEQSKNGVSAPEPARSS